MDTINTTTWNKYAHASVITAGVSFVPAAGFGVEAGARSTGMRDRVALQGDPPRENPR